MVDITDRTFGRALVVRLRPDHDTLRAAETGLGVPLPIIPGTSTVAADVRALWIGPDEWLVLSEADREADLATALGERPAALVDVSAARILITVRGAGARDLLAAVCALDLHERAFPTSAVATTLVAQVRTTILAVDATEPEFWLLAGPSYQQHLRDCLTDAAAAVTV